MRTSIAVLAIIAVLGAAAPVSAKGSHDATCTVSPNPAAAGDGIDVSFTGITQQMVRYGWFVVYDTGPTTVQAVSTLDTGASGNDVYGDNGSYTIVWNEAAGTAEFHFVVQPDPGTHLVQATFRKIFATCTYDAT